MLIASHLSSGHVLVTSVVRAASGSHPVAATHPISTAQAVILGILQGIAELFPISSLGHTVIFPSLFGWHNVVKAQANPESFWLAFVVALHVGNAVALLVYFRRDWIVIIRAWLGTLSRRRIETPAERLSWLIIIATIPAGIIGLALEHPLRVALAKPLGASLFLVVNGFILFAAERFRRRNLNRLRSDADSAVKGATVTGTQELDAMNYREAGLLGVAQSSALIAGISREGVVMGAGLARGLNHENAARFSFLMATPIILAAGLFKLPDLFGPLGNGVRTQALVGAIVAGVVSVISIRFLLRYFQTKNLNPFGVYCVLFGAATAVYLSVN